jgi:hypothetical protein
LRGREQRSDTKQVLAFVATLRVRFGVRASRRNGMAGTLDVWIRKSETLQPGLCWLRRSDETQSILTLTDLQLPVMLPVVELL